MEHTLFIQPLLRSAAEGGLRLPLELAGRDITQLGQLGGIVVGRTSHFQPNGFTAQRCSTDDSIHALLGALRVGATLLSNFLVINLFQSKNAFTQKQKCG